jgi:hypothetical protein
MERERGDKGGLISCDHHLNDNCRTGVGIELTMCQPLLSISEPWRAWPTRDPISNPTTVERRNDSPSTGRTFTCCLPSMFSCR